MLTTSQNTFAGGTSDLPQSWYPICLSSELKKGVIKPVELFKTEWVLFRGENNTPGLLRRYCPHMGTDLANGFIKEGCLTCPLHHWRFNADGKCTKLPKSDIEPEQVTTKKLSVVERYGIIFAFWGDETLFQMPPLGNFVSPAYSKPLIIPMENNILTVSLNGFDMWHFYNVHKRKVGPNPRISSNGEFHLRIDFTLEVMVVRWHDYAMKFLGLHKSGVQMDYWGGNHILVHSINTGHTTLLALAPGKHEHECYMYVVVAIEGKAKRKLSKMLENWKLFIMRFLVKEFLKPDLPIGKNMHPVKGILSQTKDSEAIRFWDYWEKLPRKSSATQKHG